MNKLVKSVRLFDEHIEHFDEHIEHFDDHFICYERINGLLICNQIVLLT